MRATQFRASRYGRRWSAVLGLLVALSALALGPLFVSASPAVLPQRRPAESLAACLASLQALRKDRTYLTNVLQRAHSREVFVLSAKEFYFMPLPIDRADAQEFLLTQLHDGKITGRQVVVALRELSKQTQAGIAGLGVMLQDVEHSIYQKGHQCQALHRPATGPAAFHLVPRLTTISNPNSRELTIDAAAGRGVVKHCCDGGGWNITFAFKVPPTLTPGKTAHVTLGMRISNVRPEQPLLMQITALAPGFAQAFSIDYPHPTSGSKTFALPVLASSSSAKELTIQIGFDSASVTYTYRP
jgi:hypothetical protein